MPRAPIHTDEDIIATGERMEAEQGSPVSPWEVLKALGGRGKYERVRVVWEEHLARRSDAAGSTGGGEAVVLTPEATAAIAKIAEGLVAQVEGLARRQLGEAEAQEREAIRALRREHRQSEDELRAERDYLRDRTGTLEEALEEAEAGRDEACAGLAASKTEAEGLRRELEAERSALEAARRERDTAVAEARRSWEIAVDDPDADDPDKLVDDELSPLQLDEAAAERIEF